jgi:ACS family D-galactonate transporter-like MFS transporter
VVFALAFLFLRELAPALRDQLMVSERDRVLVELKAKGLDIEASLRNPWRQMMHVDVIASALGVSVLLLAYYTAVGFGLIYLVTVFRVQRCAGERARELDLGCECAGADRGGSDLGPA